MKDFKEMLIPCTEDQYVQVKTMLELLGHKECSTSGIENCKAVHLFGDGKFMALNHEYKSTIEKVYIDDLRKIVMLALSKQLNRLETFMDFFKPLENFCVSLTHDSLTREDVVERCFAAAKYKGYSKSKQACFIGLDAHACFFGEHSAKLFTTATPIEKVYGIVEASEHREKTLEAFEEYCGIYYTPRMK